MEKLHEEILEEVFSYLDILSLKAAVEVCQGLAFSASSFL